MKRTSPRACLVCGISLVGRHPLARLCSDPCRRERNAAKQLEKYRARVAALRRDSSCQTCGSSISHRNGSARYCGYECMRVAARQRWRERYYSHRAEMKAKRRPYVAARNETARSERRAKRPPCVRCGSVIPANRHANARSCSLECRAILSKAAQFERASRWRDAHRERNKKRRRDNYHRVAAILEAATDLGLINKGEIRVPA